MVVDFEILLDSLTTAHHLEELNKDLTSPPR